jgi:catechol 2,3-dioxygenase-like lactoylglutathione lyase family enzyme
MDSAIVRRKDALGVHSLDRFVFTVPDVSVAERFYGTFGLRTVRDGPRLDLCTDASPHCWGTVIGNGQPKKLQYLSFAAYDDDFDRIAARFRARGSVEPHPLSDGRGTWTRDADGTPVQLVAGAKVSPAQAASAPTARAPLAGKGAAPSRSGAPSVRPRYLSHVLLFSRDVPAQVEFYTQTLGLRLSDRSGDIIAFLHAPHASEHHVLAFAKSEGRGLHHSSWVVEGVDDIGLGAERMRAAGYTNGWGLGRHVLGSNYFHYVQDPWGSFAEYSYGIDFVPADVEWIAGDHPPEDSFYVWGPPVPDDFIVNHEAAPQA